MPVIKTGFVICQTQTQIRNRSCRPSSLLRNRCNFCFSLKDHSFLSSHCIPLTSSLIYDRPFCRVSLLFLFAKDSLQGANRTLPSYSFCFSLIDCFFPSHRIPLTSSLIYSRLSCRVSLRFAKDSLQAADRALPPYSFCVYPMFPSVKLVIQNSKLT